MSLRRFLDPDLLRAFLAEHYQRLPYARAGGAAAAAELGDWAMLGRLLAKAPAEDVIVCQSGAERIGDVPRSVEEARALIDAGYTLCVRRAEQHDAELARFAAGFQEELAAPVNIHFFATPGGHWGFGWHYDVEEVFILQTAGRKDYQLRKNTVNPWPLEETMPADLRYEREIMPLMRCPLAEGDLLYIPAGYWHRAESPPTGISLSLSIGIMSPTAVTIFDRLRAEILESLAWRQRLPPAGSLAQLTPEELAAHYRALLDQLATDVGRTLRSPAFLRGLLNKPQ